jgi:hypothetical protein
VDSRPLRGASKINRLIPFARILHLLRTRGYLAATFLSPVTCHLSPVTITMRLINKPFYSLGEPSWQPGFIPRWRRGRSALSPDRPGPRKQAGIQARAGCKTRAHVRTPGGLYYQGMRQKAPELMTIACRVQKVSPHRYGYKPAVQSRSVTRERPGSGGKPEDSHLMQRKLFTIQWNINGAGPTGNPPGWRLLKVADFRQPHHDIEILHALRLADPGDFIFLDLAL